MRNLQAALLSLALLAPAQVFATSGEWQFRVLLDDREIGTHRYTVTERDGGRLEVATTAGSTSLPGCVMSFAYWNPAMLSQQRLLNAQTGEHAEVRVEPLGTERLLVRDQPVLAERYALHADDFRIDLWYAPGDRWVQLESRTGSGQRLRYLIQ